MKYFIADLHLGHSNVIKYDKRPFSSIEEMDSTIINNWNNKVKKDDTVYVLGDISRYDNKKTAEIFSNLNGQKILIKGNHDKFNRNVYKCFVSVKDYAVIRVKNTMCVLSHYPILFYDNQYHNAIMLHGHVHNRKDDKYVQECRKFLLSKNIPCEIYNVGVMMPYMNYEPQTLDTIIAGTNNQKRCSL